MGRIERCAISRRSMLPPHPDGQLAALDQQVQAWVEGGVEWIQLREKDLAETDLEALSQSLSARVRGSSTQLLVNGLSPARARLCGSNGVHLPGTVSADTIRAARANAGVVSVSCHTLDDMAAAVEGGATLAVWAPVFSKEVDKEPVGPGTGTAALHAACMAAGEMPVFALGGVTPENAMECIAAGAAGVAGIRLFLGQHWMRLPQAPP